jgi:signal transduction histidine kinase
MAQSTHAPRSSVSPDWTAGTPSGRSASGPGIAPEHLERVLDPFFTTKPVGVGTGPGLSIVKKIIDLHEGTVEIQNAPEGGAVITLAFRAWESNP